MASVTARRESESEDFPSEEIADHRATPPMQGCRDGDRHFGDFGNRLSVLTRSVNCVRRVRTVSST